MKEYMIRIWTPEDYIIVDNWQVDAENEEEAIEKVRSGLKIEVTHEEEID